MQRSKRARKVRVFKIMRRVRIRRVKMKRGKWGVPVPTMILGIGGR